MYFEHEAYLRGNQFYNPMLSKTREGLDRFLSAWGHNYFCNADGGRLIYSIESPDANKCSICGKTPQSIWRKPITTLPTPCVIL